MAIISASKAAPASPPPYVPGPVERYGRKMKMEYVGMTSVFTVIFTFIFSDLTPWTQALAAAVGTFFLFVGIKKKTRDHISSSLLLFATAAVARLPLDHADWAVPYLLFGACLCALEGYLEKRQEQVFALPLLFFLWGLADSSSVLGLIFAAVYFTHPWAERPGLRRRLSALWALSAAAAVVGAATRAGSPTAARFVPGGLLPLTRSEQWTFALLAVPVLVCLLLYWRRLLAPRRLAPLFFAVLAPFDERALAMFTMTAAVVLSASLFRLSIDSDRVRPYFKHAEWHFFWYVLALALWGVLG